MCKLETRVLDKDIPVVQHKRGSVSYVLGDENVQSLINDQIVALWSHHPAGSLLGSIHVVLLCVRHRLRSPSSPGSVSALIWFTFVS